MYYVYNYKKVKFVTYSPKSVPDGRLIILSILPPAWLTRLLKYGSWCFSITCTFQLCPTRDPFVIMGREAGAAKITTTLNISVTKVYLWNLKQTFCLRFTNFVSNMMAISKRSDSKARELNTLFSACNMQTFFLFANSSGIRNEGMKDY